MKNLITDSREPKDRSLAVFRPTEITDFDWEEEKQRDWKEEWKKNLPTWKSLGPNKVFSQGSTGLAERRTPMRRAKQRKVFRAMAPYLLDLFLLLH